MRDSDFVPVRFYGPAMGYLYLILTVMIFVLVSSAIRRRLFKPVDRREADREFEAKLREIRRDQRQ